MLFLHAVPTWCTLYVSTSAFLGVFSVVHPSLQTWALSSLPGAGARPPVLPPSFCARLCVPSGTRGRSSDRSPCSREAGSWPWEEARYLFRERVQPNLTNPSRTDVLPLPTRTLIAFYPKEQDAKGAGGFVPPRGPLRSQTTLDEVVCLALDCPPTPRAGRGPHHQFSRAD